MNSEGFNLMIKSKNTLIKSDVPNKLQGAAKQLIPPTSIRRNFE